MPHLHPARGLDRLGLPAAVLAITLAGSPASARAQTASPDAPAPLVIRNATVLTITKGVIPKGSVLVRDGRIAAVGSDVPVPPGARVIDATGKYLMPGIVDAHAHFALGDDINEMTSPVTPHMLMIDAFDPTDRAVYHALAGGVTTALLLHGSANMIGGQGVVMKTRFGLPRDRMLFAGAPRHIKFASGENPKRVYGSRNQLPATRMGNFAVQRMALQRARDYLREWEAYEARVARGATDATPPRRDLELEALADVLRGRLLVQIHCYRADEFLTELAIAREFGYRIRAFHHAVEAYKVAREIAAEGVAIATWPDWWGFKLEAWDGIPWGPRLAHEQGVRVALKSDSNDVTRRLNLEAAKVVRTGVPEEEALKMITIHPAWIVGVDDRVGSIEVGKDADLVIWSGHPLSTYSTVEQVYIDGDLFFDKSLPGYGLTKWTDAPMSPGGFGGGHDTADGHPVAIGGQP